MERRLERRCLGIWMKRLIVGAALLFDACSGAPAGPMPAPAEPASVTMNGSLVATNGGQPLNASLDFGIASSTAQNGSFTVSVPATAPTLTVSISGAGLVSRRTYVAAGNRSVSLDAIADNGTFDMKFYRELIRNGTEGANEPLRRWTRKPSIYLRTVDDVGNAIDSKTLDSTAAALRDAMPPLTGGAFTAADVTRGTETREGKSGWITVLWSTAVGGSTCGQSNIALDGGVIELFPLSTCATRCATGVKVPPRAVRHELGHALGFWHTDSPSDLMYPSLSACDGQPSARELYHAAIAYKRSPGNTDPDNDTAGTVNATAVKVR